ncbi:MAG TPA: hypothetical protein VHZ03_22610 [Trebonia sp.]|nr:hypothetical protein [Trebonia sp.]
MPSALYAPTRSMISAPLAINPAEAAAAATASAAAGSGIFGRGRTGRSQSSGATGLGRSPAADG